jgi:membrane-bound lytic murein transglycosylase B
MDSVARFLVALALLIAAAVAPLAQSSPDRRDGIRPSFDDWLRDVRDEALAAGVKPAIVDAALEGVELHDVVVERDSAQTEYVLSIDLYLKRRLTRETVRTARNRLARHRTLLQRVAAEYGVDPLMLVAVWGLESNFGRFAGVRPTVPVLATLGYQTRRGAFFRGQLLDALRILDRGDIELGRLKGSWAGAMGQPQFLPSSFLRYAVDFDGDGRRDIWKSEADVFASIANYLRENGWRQGERWGREVRVSEEVAAHVTHTVALREDGCRATRELSAPIPLSQWRTLGVRLVDGRPLPRAAMVASLLRSGKRSFLVYDNYDALLSYNCANAYAISVGVLADRLASSEPSARKAARPRGRARPIPAEGNPFVAPGPSKDQ